MNIIVSKSLSFKAKSTLEKFGNLILFESKAIVYDAISNHPDIFFCPFDDKVVVAPNLNDTFKDILSNRKIQFIEGDKILGLMYPNTAAFNVVVSENFIIGNEKVIDYSIIRHAEGRKFIHVNQAYTRCNLLPLGHDRFITSDMGIHKQLIKNQIDVLYVNPNGILLEGFNNGFIGGCCGVFDNKVFILGSLSEFPQGKQIKGFLDNMEIIELNDGPLMDMGSILFL